MSDNVAVVLSGCGVYDGSEVHEASAVCVALSRAGKEVRYCGRCRTQTSARQRY
jgi:enhancing lycopene biosynthesis protein 2